MQNSYRPDIDCLRAIAVLSVIGFHWNIPPFSGGYVGVDVFFVISGFLITRIIYCEMAGGKFSFVHFYERRVRRILPTLYVMVAVVAAVSWFILLPPPYRDLNQDILATVTFLSNILFWQEAGYFASAALDKPLLHTWSLSVEEQFYLVLPCVIWLILAAQKTDARRTVAVLSLIAIASFAWNVYQLHLAPSGAFYLSPGRAWEFLLGSLLAISCPRPPSSLRGMAIALLIGLSMIGSATVVFDKTTPFPGSNALLPCLGAALSIWACSGTAISPDNRWLQVPILLGKISYPLYLWHWPVYVLARVFFERLADFTPLSKVTLFAGTGLISFLSYRYLEMPIRTLALATTSRSIFATATVATLALLAFAGTARFNGGFPSRIDAANAALVAYERYSYDEFYRSRTCFQMPDQRAPDFDAPHCFTKSRDAVNLLLWGDSLAASYSYGFRQVTPPSMNVMQATASGCPPLIGLNTGAFPNCVSFNERIRFLIHAAKPEIVVLAAVWPQNAGEYENARRLLHDTILELGHTVPFIVLLGPAISYQAVVPRILAHRALRGLDSNLQSYLGKGLFEFDKKMASDFPDTEGFSFVSVLQSVCPEGTCPTLLNGSVPLQWDTFHLTAPGSEYIISKIWPKVALRGSVLRPNAR